MKKPIFISLFLLSSAVFFAQSVTKTMRRLPDTGQTAGFTNTFGEDNDYSQNVPFFINKNNAIVIDTVTTLMWQRTDGGEMTIENAIIYCDTLTLDGFKDWRLPTPHEGFSILNLQNNKPALDTKYFTKTAAEYWWTSAKQTGDVTKIWCTNSGGGVGNHPKSETKSAGGVKLFHVRAVRDVTVPSVITAHFKDNADGTITDNLTNLVWQKAPNTSALTWENALSYAENLTFANAADWRLPNIKEIQSLNDESVTKPSVSSTFFPSVGVKKYWSSTTLPNATTKAWYLDTQFGVTTYDEKTLSNYVICVRNNTKITANHDVLTSKNELKVFPNPFQNYLQIENEQGNESYELSNNVGQVIFMGRNIEAQDFSRLAQGIYFLKVESGKVFKLIKA